jgi:hypothetical protein
MGGADRSLSSDGSFVLESRKAGRIDPDLGKDLGCVLAQAGRRPAPPIGAEGNRGSYHDAIRSGGDEFARGDLWM